MHSLDIKDNFTWYLEQSIGMRTQWVLLLLAVAIVLLYLRRESSKFYTQKLLPASIRNQVTMKGSLSRVYDFVANPSNRLDWHFASTEVSGGGSDHAPFAGCPASSVSCSPLR
jgi:hypothetical protein